MKLKAHLNERVLVLDDSREFSIFCNVRTIANGQRKKHEVVKSLPEDKPIDPRTFPKGLWEVGRPVAREGTYLYPFFIPTNAFQKLPVWSLDSNGNYDRETSVLTKDVGYGLHFSRSNMTLGCVRIANQADIYYLVKQINIELNKDVVVTLEVV